MFFKFGSARKSIVVSLVVLIGLSIPVAQIARAGMSDEERLANFNKKRGIKASTAVSNDGHGPAPQGKATTETEVFTTQNVEPMLSLSGSSNMLAAETRYGQIVSNGGWPMCFTSQQNVFGALGEISFVFFR